MSTTDSTDRNLPTDVPATDLPAEGAAPEQIELTEHERMAIRARVVDALNGFDPDKWVEGIKFEYPFLVARKNAFARGVLRHPLIDVKKYRETSRSDEQIVEALVERAIRVDKNSAGKYEALRMIGVLNDACVASLRLQDAIVRMRDAIIVSDDEIASKIFKRLIPRYLHTPLVGNPHFWDMRNVDPLQAKTEDDLAALFGLRGWLAEERETLQEQTASMGGFRFMALE